MQTNKEAGLLEPDAETLEQIDFMRDWTLSEKLEQIGFHVQEELQYLYFWLKCEDSKSKEQVIANIHYFMDCLRRLVKECPN